MKKSLLTTLILFAFSLGGLAQQSIRSTDCWDGTVAESYDGGDGTEGNPYQIATPQQLALLAQQINSGTGGDAHYILTDDICLNIENDSIDWLVIGKETSQNLPIYFRGVFDGNGHTIEKMIIRENHVDAGLFGHTRGAVIKNLRVVDATIQIGCDIGIIVGQAYNTSIINCTVQNSTISREHTSGSYVGGLVGGFYVADDYTDTVYVKDCVSEVRFMDPERFTIAGGIVGRCIPFGTGCAVIENCENRGDVAGDEFVGGIVGSADNLPMVIKDCRNYGIVTSSRYAGGIVGCFCDGTITGCLNQSEVLGGTAGVGGIAGAAGLAKMENCTNRGGVSGGYAVGGIVGYCKSVNDVFSLDVFDCVNEGSVTYFFSGLNTYDNAYVGGIIGLWGSNIIGCVNKGDIMASVKNEGYVGGIVGNCIPGIVANCYNRGNVTAVIDESAIEEPFMWVGGISARPEPIIYNVYNTGVVTGPESTNPNICIGNILGYGFYAHYLNAYWLDDDDLPATGGIVNEPELHGSTAFVPGATSTTWTLNDAQYGTTDLLEALNFGAAVVLDSVPVYPYLTTWVADTENTNDGYPVMGNLPDPGVTFQSGDLLYSIISTNPPHVSVVGHVDGENAQGELEIPSNVIYEGVRYTVTEIGEWAFKNCTGLTGFWISATIDTIQNGAFYGCSGFTGTLDLSFFTPVLKENVFRECSGFTGLILPSFITGIPSGLFCGCSGLTGTLVLPETVEIIGEGAFARCSGFTGLVLPNGLREIREQAFSGCTGFTGNLVIPETVTHIKYQAFGRCAGFSGDLVIPNSVVELGNTQNTGYYVNPEPTSTFADCFDHLVLSQSLDTIGPRCFWGCTRLTGDLVIPEGVKAIFAYAFSECSGFNSLTLNESLDYIGAYAFNACTGLTGTLSIPESVEVGSYAFADCIGIEELVLPHDFTVVNYELSDIGYVFDGCSGLTELTIPEGWTTIVKSEFSRCGNLTHVNLPESLTKIETNAFKECTNLEAINLPEGVTEIGNGAFVRCRNLAHIELPTGLRTLGGQAFARCTSLTGEIVIPDLVQRIELMTFDSCYMLQSVVFGDSINYITEPAFENTELSSLVLKAMTPPQLQRMSSPNAWHFPADIPIIVPCGALEAYQNDENWSSFTNITEDCGSGLIEFHGSEWYYEIQDENGNITYQHLEYTADTTVNHKDVQIIIRTNTLYDKDEHQEVTREYLYLEDEVVYWWNKDLQEFTVLYDLGAQPGDSWVIKVSTETLTIHVDAVDQYYYEGQLFRMLHVSDEDDFFSGTIVCGVGHLSSFFPEQLMTRDKGFRVHGLRCYWNYGNLLFTLNRDDCDAIYANLHNGLDEPTVIPFAIYPNPTHNVLVVETVCTPSLPNQTYHITNLMGQTLMSGQITAENQQIDVSNLPEGMYFITVGEGTRKFVVR